METCASCSNPFDSSQYSSRTTPFAVVLAVYSPVSAFLNIFLISALVCTRQATQNTSNFLILCLSICDAVTSTIALPLCIFTLFTSAEDRNCNVSVMNSILFGTLYPLSGYLATILAIDRYINMDPEIRSYSKLKRVFRMPNVNILVFAGLGAFLLLSFTFAYWRRFGGTSYSQSIFALICDHINLMSILSVTCLYIRGYLRIRTYSDHSPIYRIGNGEAYRPEYVRRLCKTVLILVTTYNITRSPVYIANITHTLYHASDGEVPLALHEFMQFSFLLVFANCSINSIVVLHLNRKLKKWIMRKLCICRDGTWLEESESAL